jgi:uncharacterized protein YggU (UPF0235/DUF167 family)
MKIFVTAKPNSNEEKIEKNGSLNDAKSGAHFLISVTEPPIKGLANRAIEKVLSEYFKVPFSSVRLISGFSSKQKTFEITRPKAL